MFEWKSGRRRILAMVAMVLLAGCKVIPDSGAPGPAPAPGPGPGVALPDDQDRHRVALLVPLSGTNAAVGQAISNATTMALLDTNASDLRITSYDTAPDAGAAATQAMADGNKLILGPLLSTNVSSVLGPARRLDVPMISFSNDSSVAQPDVFVMGHIPDQSIARTVAYAATRGSSRFAAIIPNGSYGDRVEAAFRSAVSQSGGTLVAIESFDRGNTSIVGAATDLATRGGYDTVLIAEGARLAKMAAAELRKSETPVQILGPELWSGENSVATGSSLRGALFSAVSDARFRQFASSYESRFGSQPHRIATLGYDAVLITLRVARDWKVGRDFPKSAMVGEGGFLGVDGPFRFHRDGIGERAMEVRRVGDGKIDVVDPAPTQF